jgi:hypothetical protein
MQTRNLQTTGFHLTEQQFYQTDNKPGDQQDNQNNQQAG